VALPLPYRPLELRAHGVWDPERQCFYPFIVRAKTSSGTLLDAKQNTVYYIRSIQAAIENYGDAGFGQAVVSAILHNGNNTWVIRVLAAPTTAASGVIAQMTQSIDVDVLTYPNTAISCEVSGVYGFACVVYAEIPIDDGER